MANLIKEFGLSASQSQDLISVMDTKCGKRLSLILCNLYKHGTCRNIDREISMDIHKMLKSIYGYP